jgi:hypothetical protein
MELEGDSPAPRPPGATLGPVAIQNLEVTPENVVALAKLFSDCADTLKPDVDRLEQDLWLHYPWMEDPVSKWAWQQFNQYFIEGDHSFRAVLQGQYDQHVAMVQALTGVAEQYGKTEELNKALMNSQEPVQ